MFFSFAVKIYVESIFLCTKERANEIMNSRVSERANERTSERMKEPTSQRGNKRRNERTSERTKERVNESGINEEANQAFFFAEIITVYLQFASTMKLLTQGRAAKMTISTLTSWFEANASEIKRNIYCIAGGSHPPKNCLNSQFFKTPSTIKKLW